jgi:UDP-glucose 4-epimerase
LKYLITGGAGFIGSHLVDKILSEGSEVLVLDDLSTGKMKNIAHHENNKMFRFEKGTILDYDLVNSLVEKSDVVFHLAAAVGVNLIVGEPFKSLQTNITGSENVLKSCKENGKKVLVTSTSEIYGKNTSNELGEEDDRILGSPLKTRWSYSEAKAVEEILAHLYWKEFGLPTIIVRLFNTVGPRQVGDYGMVVPRFITKALNNQTIQVFGSGTQQRCFCHVSDVTNALFNLIKTPNAVGQVFNIGSKSETTIMDLALRIIELTNSSSDIELVDYSEAYESGFEDMMRRRPNISKIKNFINWEPTFGLDEIILDIVRKA